MQLRIQTVVREQLRVRAAFGNRAGIEHDDPVGLLHRGEPMGDDKCGPVADELRERSLDVALRLGVERGGGLIENQDRRILQKRACNSDTLPLAT